MQKFMTDYLDETCAAIRGRELRQTARSELADHMRERYGDFVADGLEPEMAALETIKRMGDPETLGKRITAANRSNKGLIYALIGLIIFITVITIIIIGHGASYWWFVDYWSLFSVVTLSAGYALLCCGRKLTILNFVRHVKTGALYAGGITSIIAFVLFLQVMAYKPEVLGLRAAFTVTSALYGLLLSMAARIAESRLPAPEDRAIKNLLE
jgi:hypothetical protein